MTAHEEKPWPPTGINLSAYKDLAVAADMSRVRLGVMIRWWLSDRYRGRAGDRAVVIEISTVPVAVFWLAFAGSVVFLDVVILLVGARYWRVCIPMTVLMSLFALVKRSPSITNQRDALVIVIIAVLTLALALLIRIRSLRAAYRVDPRRELGKLMSPREQMRMTYAMFGILGVLFAAALLLFKGLIP